MMAFHRLNNNKKIGQNLVQVSHWFYTIKKINLFSMGCKTVNKSINGFSNNHDDSQYFRVQYSCVWFISVIKPVTTGSQLDFVFYLDSQGTSSALFQSIQLNATCKRHCPPYTAMLRLSKAKFISKNDTILVMEKISPFISLQGGEVSKPVVFIK